MPQNKTDISDKTWDDLIDTDYSILRELAKERDDVRGDGSTEEIVAGLLASEGRPDAVPDEHQDKINVEEGEAEDEETTDEPEDEDDEPEFEKASNYEPEANETFIISAEPLQTWIGHITPLVDEAKVHLNRDEIQTRAVDPANVGMVDTALPSEAFESFDVRREGVIGLNVNRLEDILGGADSDDLVHLTYDSTTRTVRIEYGPHEFTMSLIDPDSIRQEPDLPDLDLPVEVYVDTDTIQSAIQFSDSMSDHVQLGTNDQTLHIEAEGDTDNYHGVFDGDDVDFEEWDDVSSLYSLDYVKDMVNTFECDEIKIRLGQEFPVKIEGGIENDDDETIGDVLYMLAPRIQSS